MGIRPGTSAQPLAATSSGTNVVAQQTGGPAASAQIVLAAGPPGGLARPARAGRQAGTEGMTRG
jgi:hypothetical protein